jgi:DNA-binding transcriptional regulator LsrR (DeoR family)
MTATRSGGDPDRPDAVPSRFSPQLMHAAATLYYLEDATQAEVASRLGTSRATVSRLLSEARRMGIVRIEVLDPAETWDQDLEPRTAAALGLSAVYIAPQAHEAMVGASLAPQLSAALADVALEPGDVLLVSSGRTVWEAAQAELPQLPGIVVTPTVGGQDEPEAWYQTN